MVQAEGTAEEWLAVLGELEKSSGSDRSAALASEFAAQRALALLAGEARTALEASRKNIVQGGDYDRSKLVARVL